MNEDLHVFIPQDLDPLGQSKYIPSFEQFVCTIQDIAASMHSSGGWKIEILG